MGFEVWVLRYAINFRELITERCYPMNSCSKESGHCITASGSGGTL